MFCYCCPSVRAQFSKVNGQTNPFLHSGSLQYLPTKKSSQVYRVSLQKRREVSETQEDHRLSFGSFGLKNTNCI